MTNEEIANQVVRDVAELPDRTSPEEWPEAMLVTCAELHLIVLHALGTREPRDGKWKPLSGLKTGRGWTNL